MTTDRTAPRMSVDDRVRAALGIEPTEKALLDKLAGQLDADELAVAVAAVAQAPDDQRRYALAALAAASLAMDLLGTGWWREARTRGATFFLPADDRAPATLLRSPPAGDRSNIELLDAWARDDVADHQWGPPAGYVDIDYRAAIVRSTMPENARPGDRFLMSCGVGWRVEVEVREDGKLGLTAGTEGGEYLRSYLHSSADHLSRDWAIATADADSIRQVLGIEPTEEALFRRLAGQVGETEAMLAAAAVGQAAADRHHYAVAGIAAASMAMDELSPSWWHQVHVRTGLTGVPPDARSPATLLRSPAELGNNPHAELLGMWAMDDVADRKWGAPIAYVDLDSDGPDIPEPLPELARLNDHFLLSWGPGRRTEGWVMSHDGNGPRIWVDDVDAFVAPPRQLFEWWVSATKPGAPHSATPGSPSAILPA